MSRFSPPPKPVKMPHLKARLAELIPKRLFWAGLTAMSLPVAYIIKRHVDWKNRPDSQQRMWIHQLTFWPSAALGLKLMHNGLRAVKTPTGGLQLNPKGFGWLTAGSLTVMGGFEGGYRLAKKLVPKQPKPPEPTYQDGFNAGYQTALQQWPPTNLPMAGSAPYTSFGPTGRQKPVRLPERSVQFYSSNF